MKLLPPIALFSVSVLFAGALSGCNANPDTNTHDSWNIKGVAPRFQRVALGYDAEKDGRYVDYQYANKKSIYLTMKRHFLNENPENPFQEEDKGYYEPRPVSSILPRPWEYINFEGLAWGGIIAGATGGLFIPVPIDSVIGTMSDGGGDEFAEGIRQTFSQDKATTSASYLHEAIGMEVKSAPIR